MTPLSRTSRASSTAPADGGQPRVPGGAQAPVDGEMRARPRHRRRAWRVVALELVRSVLLVPVLIVLTVLLPLLHLTIPLTAEAERAGVRLCGLSAPSARPASTPRWPWLVRRVTAGAFWKQDLPLTVTSLVASLGSFVIAVVGFFMAAVLSVVPWRTTPANPTTINLGTWATTETDGARLRWLVPVAVVLVVLTWLLLWGVGWLRALLVSALSERSEAERLSRANAELSVEVGHLAAGRATLVDAFDAERARIERDLHDGVQQDLVALTMSLGVARMRVQALPTGAGESDRADNAGDGRDTGLDSEDVATRVQPERTLALREALLTDLDSAQARAEEAMRALRETVHGIRPAVLTERGLAPALRDLAGRAPLPTTVTVSAPAQALAAISSPVSTTVYFAVSEALTNAAKHAGAQARAVVTLEVGEDVLRAVIADDGVGGALVQAPGATGLAGMAQRVESVGGRLDMWSPAGGGTRLTITAPLTPPWAQGK
ncbi:sensor histidine kinase [Actinomyces faecalis]|uniref:sensor histidine kinase n=1 Tax=Actinomyces faecalis TaxID=2722820 RepID=UPI001F174B18|nr:sensor histidine kinase [Actinomyces faecalis]